MNESHSISVVSAPASAAIAALSGDPSGMRWRQWQPVAEREFVDPDGQLLKGQTQAISQGTAASLALGAVGGRCWLTLARLRIGGLIGADMDRYGASSWRTQPVDPCHAGQYKAWVLGEMAHRLHPGTHIRAAVGQAQDVPLSLLRKADVWLAAPDNVEMMVDLGILAAALGKPLVQGAVHGESHLAIVRGYDLRDPDSVCPACSLTAQEWANLQARKGCDGGNAPAQQATRTSPVLCALAADLLASEAGKWLEELERHALKGEQLDYSILGHKLYRTQLSRNPKCPCPHQRWLWHDLQEAAAATPLGELVESALGSRARQERLLQVRAEAPWCRQTFCCSCGRPSKVCLFAPRGAEVGRCPCGQSLRAGPRGLGSVIPASELSAALAKTPAQLGLGPGASIGLSLGDPWTYLVFPGNPSFKPEPTATVDRDACAVAVGSGLNESGGAS